MPIAESDGRCHDASMISKLSSVVKDAFASSPKTKSAARE